MTKQNGCTCAMGNITAPDPEFAQRVQDNFARQAYVNFIGAELVHVAAGEVDIQLARNANLLQQDGYVHGGVLTAIVDAAAGYAALSISSRDIGVLTTELKVNFLRPASGQQQLARGRVLKPGRTLTICTGDVFDVVDGKEVHVLTSLVTMMHVAGLSV